MKTQLVSYHHGSFEIWYGSDLGIGRRNGKEVEFTD